MRSKAFFLFIFLLSGVLTGDVEFPDRQPTVGTPMGRPAIVSPPYTITTVPALLPLISIKPKSLRVEKGKSATFQSQFSNTGGKKILDVVWNGPLKQVGYESKFSVNTSHLEEGKTYTIYVKANSGKLSDSATLYIIPSAPTAAVTPTQPTSYNLFFNMYPAGYITEGDSVKLTASITPPNNTVQYQFNFGNGEKTGFSSNSSYSKRYDKAGTYYPSVEVRTVYKVGAGLIRNHLGKKTKKLIVDKPRIVIDYDVSLKATPHKIEKNKSIRFDVPISPYPKEYARYYFQFGDGSEPIILINKNYINHTYKKEGSYRASVMVTINDVAYRKYINIEVVSPQVYRPTVYQAYIHPNKTNIKEGEKVRFRVSVKPKLNGVKYQFIYGDGSQDWSTNKTSTHVYPKAGRYYAYVKAIKNGYDSQLGTRIGERDDITIYQSSKVAIDVKAKLKPTIKYTLHVSMNPSKIKEGEKVTFTMSTTPASENVEYRLNARNGSRSVWSTKSTYVKQYKKAGTYYPRVDARILNNKSKIKRVLKKLIVKKAIQTKYKASISTDKSEVTQGEEVSFTGSVNPKLANVEYQFHYGDGEPSKWIKSATSNYVYPKVGEFKAFVKAKKQGKIIQESSASSILVKEKPIDYTLFIEANSTNISEGESVRFTTSIDPLSEKVQYLVDFKNGETPQWSTQNHYIKRFDKAGTYNISVQAKVAQKDAGRKDIEIVVTKKASPEDSITLILPGAGSITLNMDDLPIIVIGVLAILMLLKEIVSIGRKLLEKEPDDNRKTIKEYDQFRLEAVNQDDVLYKMEMEPVDKSLEVRLRVISDEGEHEYIEEKKS